MARYVLNSLVPPNANWYSLVKLLQDSGLNVIDVQTSDDMPGQIIVVTPDDVDLTQAQQTTMNTVVAGFDPRPRTTRSIYAIYTDLSALTAAQKTAIWNDINSGTPPKYFLDEGPNAAALAVLDWVVKKSGASAANVIDAQIRAVAIYTQDNPKYLVNPAFANTVNIPGDRPIG